MPVQTLLLQGALCVLVLLLVIQCGLYIYHTFVQKQPQPSSTILFLQNIADFPVRKLPAVVHPDLHKYSTNGVYSFEAYTSPPKGVFDLRDKCPPVYNQGAYGDCTNQSTAFLVDYYCRNVLGVPFRPSRWMLNFAVQRFQNNQFNDSMVPVELQVYGNAIHATSKAGGSNVYNNVAVMMMTGMVKEDEFPFPTPKESASQQKVLKKLHSMFEKYRKQTVRPAELRHFIQAYNRFLRPLRLPSNALYRKAQYNRVTKCIMIDSSSIDDIRKCVHYIGPVAFDIACPQWLLEFRTGCAANDVSCVCKRLLCDTPDLNDNERTFLTEFPRVSRLYEHVKSQVWSFTTMNETYNKELQRQTSTQMQKWLHDLSTVLRPSLLKTFEHQIKTPSRSCRVSDEVLRERSTCHYPHKNEDKYKAILNAHGNRYNDWQALSTLVHQYALQIRTPHNAQSPPVKAAIAYFKGQVCGGHSMAIVGYDDIREVFIVRNSWGDSWCDKGYFYLSYDFFREDTYNPFRPKGTWIGQMICITGVELNSSSPS